MRKRAVEELEKSQWFPRKRLESLRTRRLRALIKHSYETVPYYRKVFNERKLKPEDIRSPGDLTKLPVLTKQDVKTHVDEMISTKYGLENLEERRTSGSTSIPLRYYRNEEIEVYIHASRIRFLKWMKLREDDVSAYLGPPGMERRPPKVPEPLCLYTWEITPEKFENLIENIRTYKPKALWGFASGINLLTWYCEEQGIDDVSFKCIYTTGEKLFDKERKRMEKTFKTKVYQFYGTSETGTLGNDCPVHSGIHINGEYMLIEFLKNGKPAASGEMATVVATPLINFGMPLLRYDLQDAAYRIDEPCTCGRSLPLMSYIDGRMTDILVAPDGRWLGDSNFRSRIFEHVDVRQYRIIQETVTDITVELIPGKKFDEKAERFIVKTIKKHMGEQVEVTVKKTDEIESTPSGKRRVVISHVPKKTK
jgi:phenylacetate-CoA ligase